jgi:hypothetical protein
VKETSLTSVILLMYISKLHVYNSQPALCKFQIQIS